MSSVIERCSNDDFEGIWETINQGARAYAGQIPKDRLKEPYMSRDELRHEIASGVVFWGAKSEGELLAVMGTQDVLDVTLVRHAYVKTLYQRGGLGSRLLAHLRALTTRPILIGTWADAVWAIAFYQRHGFGLSRRWKRTLYLESIGRCRIDKLKRRLFLQMYPGHKNCEGIQAEGEGKSVRKGRQVGNAEIAM